MLYYTKDKKKTSTGTANFSQILKINHKKFAMTNTKENSRKKKKKKVNKICNDRYMSYENARTGIT